MLLLALACSDHGSVRVDGSTELLPGDGPRVRKASTLVSDGARRTGHSSNCRALGESGYRLERVLP
jgi:hypothetical protein